MKAAVLEKINAPLKLMALDIATHYDNEGGLLLLEPLQVLVRIICTGICGAQIQEIDGKKGDPSHLPHLLGHEGCGIVAQTGLGVDKVEKGDKVVIHWRRGSGVDSNLPVFYQKGSHKWEKHGNTSVGIPVEIKAGPCTTFSEFTIVSENRVTRIPDDVPDDFAALLGCCLSTALSLIEKEAQPKHGDSILIVGCGGLGLAMILAASIKKNCKIFAVDISKDKRELVESLGATFYHRFDKRAWMQPYEILIDTVGDEPSRSLVRTGGKYISLQAGGSEGGGFNPDEDIPRYVDMWRAGMLDDYTKIITHRLPLDRINEGIQLMRDGKAGRVMIEMK